MLDTIAAPATAPGQAGIGIIRISGSRAADILSRVFVPRRPVPALESHRLYLGRIVRGVEPIDECMAVLMRAPASYTREDVAELQLHGSPLTMKLALDAVLSCGARPAEPGEFTLRAFLNGRIDLSQAESVMQLIRASSERSAQKALRQLEGGASAFVSPLQSRLTELLARLEAAIDYPEEVEEQLAARELADSCTALARDISAAVNERALRVQEKGLEAALLGAPNAGKSTLLNALLLEDKAIVTPTPGTTRDVVEGELYLDGCLVRLYDTAGLRDAQDQAEQIGISRALAAARQADVVFWLMDGTDPAAPPPPDGLPSPHILVTKADLPQRLIPPCGSIPISAETGLGLSRVRDILKAALSSAGETPLSSRRHMALCKEAASSLQEAAAAFSSGAPLEFGAVCLHEAMDRLSLITGANATETLLDQIFSQFCVGK